MTPDQIVILFLRRRDKHGNLEFDPAPGDDGSTAPMTPEAAFRKYLWFHEITDPETVERLYGEFAAKQRAATAPGTPA